MNHSFRAIEGKNDIIADRIFFLKSNRICKHVIFKDSNLHTCTCCKSQL